MSKIPLTKLKKGVKAKIVEVTCAKQDAHRLSTLGLRIGAVVTKFSSFALKGPLAIKVGSTTIAIGHKMAEHIIVEH